MKTPKEKAEELVEKMFYCYQGHIDEYTAKQCALICAEEVLRVAQWGGEIDEQIDVDSKEYWTKVIEEIKKL